jgi:hypothetical protein
VRLDHLLSKESTARAFGYSSRISGSSYVEHRLVGLSTTPTPRRSRAHVAPPGPAGSGHHCSVLREARAPPAVRPQCPRPLGSAAPELERAGRSRYPRPVPAVSSAARGLTRWLRTAERARASRTKKLPSYKEPTVDALAPDADEGRGWLRKATGSCRPSAMTRGYPNGETRLGSCPATPARTHRAGGGHRGN